MKKQISTIAAIALTAIFAINTSAQTCYSFDNYLQDTATNQHAFAIYGNGNGGAVSDWNVTSGTPTVYRSGWVAGVNAYNGDQYALMGVCDSGPDQSEGLSLSYPFQQGQSYKISMAIRNVPLSGTIPNPIDIKFVLLQNNINYTYNYNTGCSTTPAIPGTALVADSVIGFNQYDWQVYTFTINNVPSNFSNLWIRTQFSAGSPLSTTLLMMDSFCVQPISPPTHCYSFDDTNVPSADQQHAFNIYGNGNPGFLQDWHVPSGTPNIYSSGNIPGVNAYSGNQYAMMGICDVGYGYSEGLELAYPFTQGQSYTVSMAVRNIPYPGNSPTPIDVKFVLLTDTINYPYNSHTGCSPTPAIPGNGLVVDSMTSFDQNAWQVLSFNITNLPHDFTQLWIRAEFSNGSPLVTTLFSIDSVCIQPYVPPVTIPPTQDCYSFDDSLVPAGNQQQAFNIYGNGHPGFLRDWNVPSGTPNIESSGDIPGVNAYDGSQYAMMGICDVGFGYSEGLELSHQFQHNTAYTVSMAIRNVPLPGNQPTPINVKFILLPNAINYNYNPNTGCSPTPPIPANALVVDSTITNWDQNIWKKFSFTIAGLPRDYSQLWIRAEFATGAPFVTTMFCIDSVCINPFDAYVWPGDANGDGSANNYDILPMGQSYSDTGDVRSNASISWNKQLCRDWLNNVPNGDNEKKSDCDGNGVVNADDTLAITQNYGETHQKAAMVGTSNDPRLFINMPANYSVVPGGNIELPIYLGNNSIPVSSIYGIAFSLQYDTTYIANNSEALVSAGSWMGVRGTNMLTFSKNLYGIGRTDVALTRINKNNTAGNGLLCTLNFTMKDDVTGKDEVIRNLLLSLGRVRAITMNGTEIPINYGGIDTLQVRLTGIDETPASMQLRLYPNPANDYLIIDGNTSSAQYTITDMLGNEVYATKTTIGKTRIPTSQLSNGIYLLRAQSGSDMLVKRFSITR